MSDDQKTWSPVGFKGVSPAYVDKEGSAWLKGRPYLAVEINDLTCYGQFRRTFNAMPAANRGYGAYAWT
ncbi:hypothetical protein OG285_31605 [Streptomyces sp. NBC_01471]|uniref:hypothetical protein n=1 Tax=Streptomyces sp. NBC_01471 TaxID=2903879 RepID=UPI00324B38A2